MSTQTFYPRGVTDDPGNAGKAGKRFKAQISINGKVMSLGRFTTWQAAQAAYDRKCKEIGRRTQAYAVQYQVGRSRRGDTVPMPSRNARLIYPPRNPTYRSIGSRNTATRWQSR